MNKILWIMTKDKDSCLSLQNKFAIDLLKKEEIIAYGNVDHSNYDIFFHGDNCFWLLVKEDSDFLEILESMSKKGHSPLIARISDVYYCFDANGTRYDDGKWTELQAQEFVNSDWNFSDILNTATDYHEVVSDEYSKNIDSIFKDENELNKINNQDPIIDNWKNDINLDNQENLEKDDIEEEGCGRCSDCSCGKADSEEEFEIKPWDVNDDSEILDINNNENLFCEKCDCNPCLCVGDVALDETIEEPLDANDLCEKCFSSNCKCEPEHEEISQEILSESGCSSDMCSSCTGCNWDIDDEDEMTNSINQEEIQNHLNNLLDVVKDDSNQKDFDDESNSHHFSCACEDVGCGLSDNKVSDGSDEKFMDEFVVNQKPQFVDINTEEELEIQNERLEENKTNLDFENDAIEKEPIIGVKNDEQLVKVIEANENIFDKDLLNECSENNLEPIHTNEFEDFNDDFVSTSDSYEEKDDSQTDDFNLNLNEQTSSNDNTEITVESLSDASKSNDENGNNVDFVVNDYNYDIWSTIPNKHEDSSEVDEFVKWDNPKDNVVNYDDSMNESNSTLDELKQINQELDFDVKEEKIETPNEEDINQLFENIQNFIADDNNFENIYEATSDDFENDDIINSEQLNILIDKYENKLEEIKNNENASEKNIVGLDTIPETNETGEPIIVDNDQLGSSVYKVLEEKQIDEYNSNDENKVTHIDVEPYKNVYDNNIDSSIIAPDISKQEDLLVEDENSVVPNKLVTSEITTTNNDNHVIEINVSQYNNVFDSNIDSSIIAPNVNEEVVFSHEMELHVNEFPTVSIVYSNAKEHLEESKEESNNEHKNSEVKTVLYDMETTNDESKNDYVVEEQSVDTNRFDEEDKNHPLDVVENIELSKQMEAPEIEYSSSIQSDNFSNINDNPLATEPISTTNSVKDVKIDTSRDKIFQDKSITKNLKLFLAELQREKDRLKRKREEIEKRNKRARILLSRRYDDGGLI